MSARITPELRARLDKAADGTGRSLSDEVEERLLASFNLEDERAKIFESFGGQRNYAIARVTALLMVELSQTTGKEWIEDRWTFSQFRRGVLRMLGRWDPSGPDPDANEEPEPPNGLPDQLGESIAAALLAKLDFTAGSAFDADALRRIKHGLGDLSPQISRTEERLPEIEDERSKRERHR